MRPNNYFIYIALLFFLTSSCSKPTHSVDEPLPHAYTDSVADFTDFSIAGMNPIISLSQNAIYIRFPDSVMSAGNMIASFTLSPGAEAKVNGIKQVSGETGNSFSSSLLYIVTNPEGFIKRWTVSATNNDYTVDWGLGNFLKQSVSNDRSYKWYYNQVGSGKYSSINCGPTCATMALKWVDSTFRGTPQDARDYYPQNTDGWGMGTIATYIADQGCLFKGVDLGDSATQTRDILKAELDKGHILIIPITTSALHPYAGAAKNPKVGKYYPDVFDHFILLYGYKQVDNEFYFQVNDPWGVTYVNNDGTFSGTNRYYTYQDIFAGTIGLDNNSLSIYKP